MLHTPSHAVIKNTIRNAHRLLCLLFNPYPSASNLMQHLSALTPARQDTEMLGTQCISSVVDQLPPPTTPPAQYITEQTGTSMFKLKQGAKPFCTLH